MYVEIPDPPIQARIRHISGGRLRLTLDYPAGGETAVRVRQALSELVSPPASSGAALLAPDPEGGRE